ncbi:hypothetical protein Ciccas_011660 [Cichlidogyrus casuarinus]|uniref:Uncharacterized protein n=1 Tax=Cichlidogyrus casuarinus TaxID=1844966 RepID=A0ABD2PQL3_9PLAT
MSVSNSKDEDLHLAKLEREARDQKNLVDSTLNREEEQITKKYQSEIAQLTNKQHACLKKFEKERELKRKAMKKALSKQGAKEKKEFTKIIRKRLDNVTDVEMLRNDYLNLIPDEGGMSLADRVNQPNASSAHLLGIIPNGPATSSAYYKTREKQEKKITKLERSITEKALVRRKNELVDQEIGKALDFNYYMDRKDGAELELKYLRERQEQKQNYLMRVWDCKRERIGRLNQIELTEIKDVYEYKRNILAKKTNAETQVSQNSRLGVVQN